MPKLRGEFRQGEDVCYSYEASWQHSGSGIAWEAKVRLKGKLVGMPSGELSNVSPESREHAVRKTIEATIATGSAVTALPD